MLRLVAAALTLAAAAPPERSRPHTHLFTELSCGPRDPSVDCAALVALNAAVGVAGWATGESFCGWPGVLCDDDGRVIALSLREMDLKSNAKEKMKEPSKGKSDSHIQRGKRLRKEVPRQLIKRDEVVEKEEEPFVDASLRQCGKRPFFPHRALAKLEKLEVLSLIGLNMTGTVPQSLNALSSLRELHLAENSLSGSLPELDDLTQLQALHFDGNGFSGTLGGLLRSLARSPLRRLGLSRNSLTGHLPGNALEKLTSLESLRIGGNRLDGPFPVASLAKLPNLTNVSVWGNAFEGDASLFLDKASSSLKTFDATSNKLRGDLREMPRRNLENLRLGGNALEGSLPKPANLRDVASLQLWSEVAGRSTTEECDLEPTCGGASAANLALSRALDDATLWLGGDVRPWQKLLQDDERKGGPVRSRKKDDDIGSDMLKEMRRERDRNERKLARSGGGKKLKDFRKKIDDPKKKNSKNVLETMYASRRSHWTRQVADFVESVDAAEKAESDAAEAAKKAAKEAEQKAKRDADDAAKALRDAELAEEKAAKVLKATTDKERRKAEDTRDAAVRLKASGERRRRIDARSDDAEQRMADVRRGVDRVKELMERHESSPSEAERLNSYDDGVRRSQQFADRRKEIDAGVAAARARATSMRDRYSGGRAASSSRDVRGETPEDSAGRAASSDGERREAPEDWHADALPDSHQFRAGDAFPAAVETDKAFKADDATTEQDGRTAQERERAWAAAFARAEAAEAREKAKAAGAPVVAAAIDAGVPADKETRLEELRKRARETVRLASQGEEF